MRQRISEGHAFARRSARLDRIRARAPRHLMVVTILVLSLLGTRELVWPRAVAPTEGSSPSIDHPSEDFAQRFARAYLAYDVERPGRRERELRAVVPDELDLDGFVATRSQRVLWTQVAQNQEALAGGRVIVVAAEVSTQADPLYLAVPVVRDDSDAVGLAGHPALVGPPTVSGAPLAAREEVTDGQIAAVARRAVANYLAGALQNLQADLAAETVVSLPTRELRLVSVEGVDWANGENSGAVLVTVLARDALRFEWRLTYEIGIDRGGTRPYATFIETIPNAP